MMIQVADTSPWKNGESRPAYGFIGGDAVDLKLNVPGRRPLRLLVAPIHGADTVTLWQQRADQPENPQTYAAAKQSEKHPKVRRRETFVRRPNQSRDRAGRVQRSGNLSAPRSRIECRFFPTRSRSIGWRDFYWENKTTGMVSDLPTESKLEAEAWGKLNFKP